MSDERDDLADRPLTRFKAEHHVILSLVDQIGSALDDGDIATAHSMLPALARCLGPHAAAEEQTLFAVLRSEEQLVAEVDQLETEHARVAASIAALAELGDAAWTASVATILTNVRGHIEREEHGVFAASVQTLSSEGWQHVAVRLSEIERIVT